MRRKKDCHYVRHELRVSPLSSELRLRQRDCNGGHQHWRYRTMGSGSMRFFGVCRVSVANSWVWHRRLYEIGWCRIMGLICASDSAIGFCVPVSESSFVSACFSGHAYRKGFSESLYPRAGGIRDLFVLNLLFRRALQRKWCSDHRNEYLKVKEFRLCIF